MTTEGRPGLQHIPSPLCDAQIHPHPDTMALLPPGPQSPRPLHIPSPAPPGLSPPPWHQDRKWRRKPVSPCVLRHSHGAASSRQPLGHGAADVGGSPEGQIQFKKTLSCSNYLGHLPETQLLSPRPSFITLPARCHLNVVSLADRSLQFNPRARSVGGRKEEKEEGSAPYSCGPGLLLWLLDPSSVSSPLQSLLRLQIFPSPILRTHAHTNSHMNSSHVNSN